MRNIPSLVLICFISACSNAPEITKPEKDASQLKAKKIYVISHGWHTSFVLPASAIQQNNKALKARFGNTPYIEIGWGDKGFYQAEEITGSLTIRAILWPTESVIHAVAVPEKPDDYFVSNEIEEICLTENEYYSLVNFINNSFKRDLNNKIMPLQKGLYGNSQFYQGRGSYHILNTCNVWTAKGLASAGFDIVTMFKLTAGSIMNYLKNLEEASDSRC